MNQQSEVFEAILIKNDQRSPIHVTFEAQQLTASHPNSQTDPSTTFLLAEFTIEIGGSNNSLIFLKKEDLVIYLRSSKALSKHLLALNSPYLNPILSQQYAGRKRSALFYSAMGLLFFAFIFSLIKLKAPTINYVAEKIPFEYEKIIGDKMAGVMISPTEVITDAELKNQLELMLSPLKKQLEPSIKQIKVHISDNSAINAFAFPGGHIVFNLGLLKKSKRAEEILGVAAHELAHVSRRHGIKNLLQGAGLFLIVQTLIGDMTGLAAVIADQGQFLLQQKFSREFETEADQTGFDYLVNAGIDPTGMIDFFKILQQEHPTETELAKNLSYLSTHPQTDERIENIKRLYANLTHNQLSQIKPLDFNFAHFKSLLTQQQ